MTALVLSVSQKLTAARIIIRDRLPYFRSLLFGAMYKELPGLGTYAMTENGILLYDPAVIAAESVDECAGSIMHELLHWLRDHAKRCRAIAANPKIWNLAADAEINDDIRDMGLKLPPTVIYAAHFGCKDGSIAEVYYQAARQQIQQQQGNGDGQEGEGEPKVGHGWCGSCAGRPNPKEGKDGKGSAGGDGDAKGDGEGDGGEGRSDAEAGRIRKQVAEAAVKHAATKGRGSVPAGFLAWAESEIAPAKIDWRTKLAKVLKASMAYRPGCVATSWAGFGRKQAALGFGPGRPMTPKWVSPVPRIGVGVDTSGSMGGGTNSPLAQAASEVDGILKATNAAVQFVACDAQVHSAKAVKTWQEAVREFKGGGGTDFRPVFAHFDSMKKELPPEVVIFITDGYGPAPVLPPKGYKVIWVLVGGNTQAPATWGDVVVVDPEPAKRT